MENHKLIVVIEGSSGVGKSTIMNELILKRNDLKKIVSYTSRQKRSNEVHGVDYFFISPKQFEEKIRNNELLEHDTIHGIYKGIGKDFIKKSKSDDIFIKEMTLEGLFNVRKTITDHKVVAIFVTEKKKVLKQRLISRGEKDWELRLKSYGWQQKSVGCYDYVLCNTILQTCVNNFNTIIDVEYLGKPLLPLLSTQKFKEQKVNKYVNLIAKGKELKPIKITIHNNEIYILEGTYRYIASVLMKSHLLKKVVDNKKIITVNSEKVEWEKIIKNYEQGSYVKYDNKKVRGENEIKK